MRIILCGGSVMDILENFVSWSLIPIFYNYINIITIGKTFREKINEVGEEIVIRNKRFT